MTGRWGDWDRGATYPCSGDLKGSMGQKRSKAETEEEQKTVKTRSYSSCD